jgi:hypothetical protein
MPTTVGASGSSAAAGATETTELPVYGDGALVGGDWISAVSVGTVVSDGVWVSVAGATLSGVLLPVVALLVA